MSRAKWLEWRRQGIGASDSPAIMGVSPYKTILQIYEDKISTEAPVEISSRIMEKGNELEPVARKQFAAHFNLLNDTDETFEPKLVTLEEFPFMKASLDGCSKNGKIIVEIKLQGKENHVRLAEGQKLNLPDGKSYIRLDYWTQMQHQFICSGAEEGYLCSINDTVLDAKKLDVKWIKILPDREYQKLHFRSCVHFWDCVQNKTPPQPGGDDLLPLTGMDDKIKLWKKLKLKIENEEEELESLRKEILAKVTHPKMYACGVTITEVEKQGSVDYKKIPELKGVDLEKYRKASSKYYKMDIK